MKSGTLKCQVYWIPQMKKPGMGEVWWLWEGGELEGRGVGDTVGRLEGEQRCCEGDKDMGDKDVVHRAWGGQGRSRDKGAARTGHRLWRPERCVHGTLGRGPEGSPGAFGAGPSRGNAGSGRKWGSCPAALPRRGWGRRVLLTARARPTRSPTAPRPRQLRARTRGAAGEQSGGGPASLRRDLGEPTPPGCGPRLLPRRPRKQGREPEGLRSLLPEAAQPFCLSEPLFPHL